MMPDVGYLNRHTTLCIILFIPIYAEDHLETDEQMYIRMPGALIVILVKLVHSKLRACRRKERNIGAILACKYYGRWNRLHMLLCEVSMICISFFPIYLLSPSVPVVHHICQRQTYQCQDAYAKLEPLDANQKSLTTLFVCLAPLRLHNRISKSM